jgi:hypothetical protein
LLRHAVLLREKLAANVAGEVSVDGEIEPFQNVADQSGKSRPQGGLAPVTCSGHLLWEVCCAIRHA